MYHGNTLTVTSQRAAPDDRRTLLRRLGAGGVLAATALVAGAGGQPMRALASAAPPVSEMHALVGSWRLTFMVPGVSFETLATIHADGTLVKGGTPAEMGPPGSGIGRYLVSTGHGAWAQKPGSHASEPTVAFTFVELTYDESGIAQGSNIVRGELTPDAEGMVASGPFRFEARSLDGHVLSTANGTLAAQRIAVAPL